MKKFAVTFWGLYMLFFAIPFPIFLYYAINSEFDISTLKDKNPYIALGLVLLSVILWLIVLAGYFKKWIVNVFISRRNIERIKSGGVHREAKILHAAKFSKPNAKFNSYELELLFKNLADTEIVHKTIITDSKPHERRFETGKKINLLLNRNVEEEPHFIINTTTATLNIQGLFLRILSLVILTAVIIWYYYFSYQTESFGMGWRFICIGHPLIICALSLLFLRFPIGYLFRRLSTLTGDSMLIKFKGLRTQARLISVSGTGTYINEQPMMHFELEYTDNKHRVHRSTLKKVIGFLDFDLTKKEFIDIFYLPEYPNQIAFASDINKMR